MRIKGKVIPGHGVASGIGEDSRYPDGTLRQQIPYFLKHGLDLNSYFLGTINLDIAPYQFKIGNARLFLKNIDWSDYIPPENFFFFDVEAYRDQEVFEGLIYMPDPATKKDHAQKESVLELILPKIDDLHYGDTLVISVPSDQMRFFSKTD